jgi:hypothetical protein
MDVFLLIVDIALLAIEGVWGVMAKNYDHPSLKYISILLSGLVVIYVRIIAKCMKKISGNLNEIDLKMAKMMSSIDKIPKMEEDIRDQQYQMKVLKHQDGYGDG